MVDEPKIVTKRIAEGYIRDQFVEAVTTGFLVNRDGRVWLLPTIIERIMNESKPVEIHWEPENEEIPYTPYNASAMLTPMQPLPLINPRDLYAEVYREFDYFLDVYPRYKTTLSNAIFFSYQQQKSETTPYFYFSGEQETGKTRGLELFEKLAYRPMLATSITGPNVFRYLKGGAKTILDDEVKESLEKDFDKRAIYLTGYRKSAKVPRIIEDKQVFFPTYSFKAFTSVEVPRSLQFMSRCIKVDMVRGEPRYGGFIKEDKERFRQLRNKLLLWKVQTLQSSTFPDVRPSNRTDELFFPLINTAQMIRLDNSIITTITEMKNAHQSKKESKIRDSLASKVTIAVWAEALTSGSNDVLFENVWSKLIEVLNGYVDDKGRIISSEFGFVTMNKVGRIIGGRLHGEKRTIATRGGSRRVWRLDQEILRRSWVMYYLKNEDFRGIVPDTVFQSRLGER